MKLSIEVLKENSTDIFRRAGYTFIGRKGDQMSFVMPLSSSGYPRFHIYSKSKGVGIEINIHLDQKKHTYGNATRHHGEYEDSSLVENEVERLKKFF